MVRASIPWNHNSHYHRFLLTQLPSPIGRALDIGCGHGAFAGLMAEVAAGVDAIDVDGDALSEAHRMQSGHANLKFILGDFLNLDLPEAHTTTSSRPWRPCTTWISSKHSGR